ncbi:holo-ACP synthase [Pseudaquidulcibacter saccharophilus]|uniref:holo-ACP synthase n=1 Tax=Pseudaquidulcibacter saccharophilus TaxID=2831900 RepID=UPI001EFF2D8A|nr:holo-ACP synthase [Pseudaquidulcibacter saccharophilus]
MIIGIGSDICRIDRIEKSLLRFGKRFENRCFTSTEQSIAEGKKAIKAAFYAKRFAAKEAFVKAIGGEIKNSLSWLDIEIVNLINGQPVINLTDHANRILNKIIPQGFEPKLFLTLSDDYPNAIAFVIIEAIEIKKRD